MGKLKNGKAAGKDEITGEMIRGEGDRVVDFEGCVVWYFRMVLCRKTGDLLWLFHCTRVKEKGWNVVVI